MALKVFTNTLAQLLATVGAIIVFGLIIASANLLFYKFLGKSRRRVIAVTGIIGTPIHELSHAAMCVLFGHRINDIKLFDLKGEGVLGYVNHSYNKSNIYHQLGNFFIGVAPVLFGSLILLFLEWALIPDVFGVFAREIGNINSDSFLASMFSAIGQMCKAFFSVKALSGWRWWIFLIIGMFIAIHMDLSIADMKSSGIGLLVILALSVLINLICALIGLDASDTFTSITIAGGSYVTGVLLISALMSFIAVFIAAFIRGIIYIIGQFAKRSQQ